MKINKDMLDFNHTLDQVDLKQTSTEHPFQKSRIHILLKHRIFFRMGQMLDQNTVLANLRTLNLYPVSSPTTVV